MAVVVGMYCLARGYLAVRYNDTLDNDELALSTNKADLSSATIQNFFEQKYETAK